MILQTRMTPVPFVFHDVDDVTNPGEAIQRSEYYDLGKVTEYRALYQLACLMKSSISCLKDFGKAFSPALFTMIFVSR
jgi:hypothetical protein